MNSVAAAPAESTGLQIGPLTGLGLGLLAGAIVWGIVQGVHPVFSVPAQYHVPSIGMPPELFARFQREQDRVDGQHAMLYLGSLGLLLAAAFGAVESVKRRSWLPPLAAPLGAAGGALGGWLSCLMYQYVRVHVGQAELAHTIEAQLLASVPLGLGVGLGLGLPTRTIGGVMKAAVAGAGGGILAAVVYPVAVSILMPAASTEALLPDSMGSQALWLAILAGLIGVVAPLGARRKA